MTDLLRLQSIANDLGAERLSREAAALADRISEGRFFVACLGQFKRGKSTLLDALLGEKILPTGVVPVTAIPTIIRYGDSAAAHVRGLGNEWRDIPLDSIADYVTEEGNPHNERRTSAIEVFLPSALLAGGMTFVDTPGLGSIFTHATETTRSFLPHIDAAIIVLGSDPPISADELRMVTEISKDVRELIFVLNKSDRVGEEERQAARIFSIQAIEERLGRPVGTMYVISALERLEDRGPRRDWDAFVQALSKLSENSGQQLVREATLRGAKRLARQLHAIAAEQKAALLRPVEASEQRIARLRDAVKRAETSLGDLTWLFMGERKKLANQLTTRRDEFLKMMSAELHVELTHAMGELPHFVGPRYRSEASALAQQIARNRILPWLLNEQGFAGQEFARAMERFTEMASGFIRQVSEEIASAIEWDLPLDDEHLGSTSRFQFHDLITQARPASPFRNMADILLALVGARSEIESSVHEFLDDL
ncbi:MAG TPA: dynamin family protein, partial [Candidatus Kapabacteria bacterium]|nr:dynamin family protein [Candidatus Kapabacteria bacterium]